LTRIWTLEQVKATQGVAPASHVQQQLAHFGVADAEGAGLQGICSVQPIFQETYMANGIVARHSKQPEPFFREAGTGPGVVCTHANASTSGQWRGLMELLAPKFHVLSPDSYDCGKSPRWPSDRIIRLQDEVALIEPVLARAGSPLALVGHSYGAAVALVAAVAAPPGRMRAMALYEPTLFALLDAEKPAPNEAEG
jgi:pimeloyl-ACP methyl ester carboxylesterase